MSKSKDIQLLSEIYEEGFFSRMKAGAAGLGQGLKNVASNVKATAQGALAGATGNVQGVEQAQATKDANANTVIDAKGLSIMKSHINKLGKGINDFSNDLEKLGLNDQAIAQTNPELAAALSSLIDAYTRLNGSIGVAGKLGKEGGQLDKVQQNIKPQQSSGQEAQFGGGGMVPAAAE